MAIVPESVGEAPQIPDGLYTFKILSSKQDLRADYDNKDEMVPYLELKVQVADTEDDDGNEVILNPRMTLKFARGKKKSNLYYWAVAAGVCPPEGYPFDTDLLNGRVLMGKIETEAGKWPKVVPEALMPVKAVKGQPVPMSQKAQEAADTPPWEEADALVVAEALAQWFESLISLDLKRDDIIDAALDVFGKPPKNLTAAEREQLAKSLRV